MWQKEGMEREQVIACTAGSELALRAKTKDGIHRPRVWWMGNISDARVLDPCLTPVCRALPHTGFPSSCCLLSHPSSLFGTTRRIVTHDSRHAAFQPENG